MAESEDGLAQPRRLVAIAALSLGSMLTVIDGGIATVALPTIARDLHIAPSAAVLVVTVYQLVLVMMLLPCSGLGDRIGMKRFYQYGQLLFVVATVLCFFAKSLPFLLVVRAMQAVGAAAMLSMMSAMIRNIYPARHLGRGLGVNSLVASASGAMAPTVGALILGVAPWPWVFAAAAPFAILSLFIGWKALPDVPPIVGRYDLGGAMLNMATFGLLTIGVESAVHGDSPVVSAAIVMIGVIFAIWFVRHELAEDRPILPVDLLARPILALSVSGQLLAFAASMLIALSMPFRLQHGYGYTPGEVGAVLTVNPVMMMICMPLTGSLADRLRPGIQGGIGMTITVSALLLVAFLPSHPTFFDLAWRLALNGIGTALFLPSNSRLIIRATPRDRATAAGGLISTTRLVGQTSGATMVAALLSAGWGTSAVPVFVAAGFAAVAGAFSVSRMALPRVPDRPVAIEELADVES